MNDRMTDDILVLKAIRRKYESLWRKTRITVHLYIYSESCMAVKTISRSKSGILQKKISDCNGDHKKLFNIVDTLLGRNKQITLPKYDCCCCLPTPMTLVSRGSLIFPLVVQQPASPSICPAVHSLRRVCPQIQGANAVRMWVQLKR